MKNIEKLKTIFKKGAAFMTPPPILAPSEWAENNLVFVDGPSQGQSMRLYSFQKQIADSLLEGKKKIVMKLPAQAGKTNLMNAMIGYKMFTSGHNVGILQSTTRELGQWLNGKLLPMIQQSDSLRNLITSKSDKNATNNQAQIQLTNGSFLYMMSLTSPSHLRGKSIGGGVFLDEVDAATPDPSEGDPILLAEQRVTTFQGESPVVISSTPTTRHGAISVEYDKSDKRLFYCNCPHCSKEQTLEWENVKFEWEIQQGKKIPIAKGARYVCPHCQTAWTEGDRIRAIAGGKFRATNPASNIIGFHITRLVSPLATVESIVQDFADAYQSFSLQVFYNTALATSYDDLNAEVSADELEQLKTDVSVNNIPDDVVFLVAGGDQQKDRLENTLIGVSEKALYILDHRSFYDLDCERPDSKAYTELINFLKSDFKTVSGQKIPVLWANLDSGNGRATQAVYRNCNRWNKLHAIKGSSSPTAPTVPIQPTRTGGQELFVLGVNQLKYKAQEIINRNLKGGAPVKLEISNTVPDDYSEQLTAEELKRVGAGVKWVIKKGFERNEAMDCFNYGIAAIELVLKGIKNNAWKRLREYKAKINTVEQPQQENAANHEIDASDSLKPIAINSPEIKQDNRNILKPDKPAMRRPQTPGWIKRR